MFLEILEKNFINNIMNEDEIKEYEELCKIKNINNNDNSDEIMDVDSNINGEKDNDNIKMKIDDEFIDIREILSEEKFNEVRKDNFLND